MKPSAMTDENWIRLVTECYRSGKCFACGGERNSLNRSSCFPRCKGSAEARRTWLRKFGVTSPGGAASATPQRGGGPNRKDKIQKLQAQLAAQQEQMAKLQASLVSQSTAGTAQSTTTGGDQLAKQEALQAGAAVH